MKRLTCIHVILPLAIAAIVILAYFAQVGFLVRFEDKAYDLRFQLRGGLAPSSDIVIVAIDDHSIGEFGRFPWTRTRYARLIDELTKAGAKSILLDVFFSEPESKKADSALAEAIKRSGIVTLSTVINYSPDGKVSGLTKNILQLDSASRSIGHVNMAPDVDGVIRWHPIVIKGDDTFYPSLALAGVKEYLGVDKAELQDFSIAIAGSSIPVDASNMMLVNYTGPAGLYKTYSFSDVAGGIVEPSAFKGKTVIVGATAIGIYDLRVTPFSNNMPGVEIHANVIDNILRGDFMRRGGMETILDIALIAGLSVVVSLFTLRISALWAFPFTLAVMFGHSYFAYWMFLRGHWINMVFPILGIMLSFSVTASMRFFVVERREKEIRSMFSSYVSKKIVDQLVKHPEMARIGGQKKTITILFTDIKNYTSFSEKRQPEEVVGTLNEFLVEMTYSIMRYDGTLNKFIGDAILAFWGAPIDQENQAQLAVQCAMDMTNEMEKLSKKWIAEGKDPLEIGIGLHTGEVVVGNIGVPGKKMEYTAIGDAVNLTHRLQNVSRDAKRPVMSEALYLKVKDVVDAEFFGEVKVKGREESVRVYALIGVRD